MNFSQTNRHHLCFHSFLIYILPFKKSFFYKFRPLKFHSSFIHYRLSICLSFLYGNEFMVIANTHDHIYIQRTSPTIPIFFTFLTILRSQCCGNIFLLFDFIWKLFNAKTYLTKISAKLF